MNETIELYCQFCGEDKKSLLELKIHLLKNCSKFSELKQKCDEPDCPYFHKDVPGSCGCNRLPRCI